MRQSDTNEDARLERIEANYRHDRKVLSKLEAGAAFDGNLNHDTGRVLGSGEPVPLRKIADYFICDIMREIDRIPL
jgi:hypothetical protein